MTTDIMQYQFINQLKALSFIEAIWLFGSRARGDNRERSDIDIAILCPKATEADWRKVTDIIEDADTLLKIDCLKYDKDELSEDLLHNILRDRRVLYVKERN